MGTYHVALLALLSIYLLPTNSFSLLPAQFHTNVPDVGKLRRSNLRAIKTEKDQLGNDVHTLTIDVAGEELR